MTPADFFKQYASEAMSTQIAYKVPASITLAQAALESAWGESGLTKRSKNFFGIKADSSWRGPKDVAPTQEFVNGAYITISSGFRKYSSASESFKDHAKFLLQFPRYNNLWNNMDYVEWANELQKDGYATDPLYASKLINMIRKYKLDAYDKEAELKKKLA